MQKLKEKLELVEQQLRERLKEKREADSHYQQLKRTPEGERKRNAVDEIGKMVLDHERKLGREPTYEECRKKAEESMQRVDRRR